MLWGEYANLNFPDADFKKYVVAYEYGKWKDKSKKKILAYCKVFNEVFTVDHYFVQSYGSIRSINHDIDVLIDSEFVKIHPEVLEGNSNYIH